MSSLRDTILAEEDLVASKRRFALFSQPPPLAVGDDGEYQKLQHPKGEDGKPITKPSNMLSGTCKSGLIKSSYFSVPKSIHSEDPFKEQYKRDCEYAQKFHTRAKFHETQFKPASGAPKVLDKPSYKYIEERPVPKNPIERTEAGKPRTEDRNFQTNLTSNIQSQFFKNPQYMSDPYDRPKEQEKRDRQTFRSKIPKQSPMFRSMSHGAKTFSKDVHIYGEDAKAKSILTVKRSQSQTLMPKFPHEAKFKLARRGHGDTLGQYPQYIEKKTMETMDTSRKQPKGQAKQSWKPNNWSLTRPTPSISYHPKNLNIGKYK